MDIESFIKDLSPELQEKARTCGSVKELLELAKEAEVPVPDEALAAIAGGTDDEPVGCGEKIKCPNCGSTDVDVVTSSGLVVLYRCCKCGHEWWG